LRIHGYPRPLRGRTTIQNFCNVRAIPIVVCGAKQRALWRAPEQPAGFSALIAELYSAIHRFELPLAVAM